MAQLSRTAVMQSDRSGESGSSWEEKSRDAPSFSRQCNVEGQTLIRRAQNPTFEGENLCPVPFYTYARTQRAGKRERVPGI
eukprot:9322776-Alexandrium_andersonii.AAC.1